MAPPETEFDIIRALEKRVADLEARVRRLEGQSAVTTSRSDPCPNCGGALKLTDERDHPMFGAMGVKERIFTCGSCGRQVKREWDPSKK